MGEHRKERGAAGAVAQPGSSHIKNRRLLAESREPMQPGDAAAVYHDYWVCRQQNGPANMGRPPWASGMGRAGSCSSCTAYRDLQGYWLKASTGLQAQVLREGSDYSGIRQPQNATLPLIRAKCSGVPFTPACFQRPAASPCPPSPEWPSGSPQLRNPAHSIEAQIACKCCPSAHTSL